MKKESLEKKDIQGMILYGYGHVASAYYVMLEITDEKSARNWLKTLPDVLLNGEEEIDYQKPVVNIAFTYEGFAKLGLSPEALQGFSPEFIEGQVTEHRKRILGDRGASDPNEWIWGAPHQRPIHILLALFGKDETHLKEFYKNYNPDALKKHGLSEVIRLEGLTLKDRKEHFGFRDGISQPIIEGSGRQGHKNNTVPAGEFILGYANAYGKRTESPKVTLESDKLNLLPFLFTEKRKDFGRNGSYLVFRQLSEDVQAFWNYMFDEVRKEHPGIAEKDIEKQAVKLASKMMGRWPSGAPMAMYPENDPNENFNDENEVSNEDDFGYADDATGLKCPMGSHVRRANPRDMLEDADNAAESHSITNKHRIIRRSRPYGQPYSASMRPSEIIKSNRKDEVGIHFLCFNGNIARQFEFIQRTWLNNPKLEGMYRDPDPIAGEQPKDENGVYDGAFTEPSCPFGKRYKNIPQFVHTRGGAYFFMPSISAIRYLATD